MKTKELQKQDLKLMEGSGEDILEKYSSGMGLVMRD